MRPHESNEERSVGDRFDGQGMMTHAAARAALQADADGRLNDNQRRALQQHLEACAECRAYQADLVALEERLARSLQARWPTASSTTPELASKLGTIQSRARRQTMYKNVLRTAALAAAVILFVFFLSWSVRSLLPSPAGPSEITPSAQPSPLSTVGRQATSTIVASATSPASFQGNRVALFPETEFTFSVEPPDEPQQVQLFQQKLPEVLSIENARQMAARLGIQGEPAQMQGEIPTQVIYEVTDGFDLVRLLNSPDVFVFSRPARSEAPYAAGEALSPEQMIATAEAFLQSYNLLTLPYQVELNLRGQLEFTPLLEGRRVLFGIGDTASATGLAKVELDAAGQVSNLYYSKQEFLPLGAFPILSAAQAWERLSAENAAQRAMFAVLSPPGEDEYRQWSRPYRDGQRVDLYGYLQIVAPEDGERQVWIRGYAIANDAILAEASRSEFLHLWGQFASDTAGRTAFTVEGWEISNLEEEYLSGKVQRQGDRVFFVSDDGRSLYLPDAPQALVDGEPIIASGIVQPSEPGTLEWQFLESGEFPGNYGVSRTCGGGGGGGGGGPENANFGGGVFSLENVLQAVATLTPVAPSQGPATTPTPPAALSPLEVGQEISGLQGTINFFMHIYSDGRQALEATLAIEPGILAPGPLTIALEGPRLQDSKPYQSLPVKVWGKVVGLREGMPLVSVERLEEAYPGLRVQAWLGATEAMNLEGQDVLLFTAQDGKQYVLKNSIGCGVGCQVGQQGNLVVYEGYLLPDQSFAGYPLLLDLVAGIWSGGEDLSAYTLTSGEIGVWDETGGAMMDFYAEHLRGQVTIDQVELAYAAITFSGGGCTNTPETQEMLGVWLIAQPVWVFSGHFEDGRLFVVQVQALPN